MAIRFAALHQSSYGGHNVSADMSAITESVEG
jgi:hypothetical protein